MLRSCAYCGKIHDSKYNCGMKPKRFKNRSEIDSFRSKAEWQKKVEEIRERDRYLCQVCIRNIYNTKKRINHERLSVHHAIPLKVDYNRRLDNDNLLLICDRHHEMAESGLIPYDVIKKIIVEQESNPPGL